MVRRILTFIEHLLGARLFIYVHSFNLQGTIISPLWGVGGGEGS